MDALHVLALAAGIDTSAARFAYLVMVAQAGDQFALEFAARVQIDCVVDRLVIDRFVGDSGQHGAQYVRNLLRQPDFFQTVSHFLK